MTAPHAALIGLVATAAAGFGVEAVRRIALQRQILDVPNERSSHVVVTPRGGGLAIVAVCVVGWLVALAAGWGGGLAVVAVASLLVAAVSWIDDVRTLSTVPRFAAHFVAAGLVVALVGFWPSLSVPLVGMVPVGVFGAILAVVWIVGLTNAYNFMDGIDGIAGGQAMVAGAAWFAAGLALDLPAVALSGILVGAASLGFLSHNWPPARIFMGDVGSAFLGFVLAALGVLAAVGAEGGGDRVPLAALLFVWPFVYDAVYTFMRRLRAGEDVFAAHRSHLYQRLVIAGRPHRWVSTLYATLAVASAAGGYVWLVDASSWAALVALTVPPAVLLPMTMQAERERMEQAGG